MESREVREGREEGGASVADWIECGRAARRLVGREGGVSEGGRKRKRTFMAEAGRCAASRSSRASRTSGAFRRVSGAAPATAAGRSRSWSGSDTWIHYTARLRLWRAQRWPRPLRPGTVPGGGHQGCFPFPINCLYLSCLLQFSLSAHPGGSPWDSARTTHSPAGMGIPLPAPPAPQNGAAWSEAGITGQEKQEHGAMETRDYGAGETGNTGQRTLIDRIGQRRLGS